MKIANNKSQSAGIGFLQVSKAAHDRIREIILKTNWKPNGRVLAPAEWFKLSTRERTLCCTLYPRYAGKSICNLYIS